VADVRPFRAVRYASPSADVTAPPYDVLDEPQRVELRARDPHNVVQLTCDPDETAGGHRFRAWLDEGVLVRDETPAIWEAFADLQLLIADGHHRYETAVAYSEEGGGDRLLAVLVSTDDPGLAILPTHRVFSGRPDVALDGEAFDTPDAALEVLATESYDHAAAVLVRPASTQLVRGERGELDPELVERVGREGIAYTPDASDAVARVRAGDADCAFLLRATRIDDVFDRSRRGITMPPKSTYFFPKLVSGLLFHPLEP
jgi:uncharacterized protein (DUF1015 family)